MLVHHEHRVHRQRAARSVKTEKFTRESEFPKFAQGCRTGAEAQTSQCVRVVYSGTGQVHTTQQQPTTSSHAAGAWADRVKFQAFFGASRGIFGFACTLCSLYQHQSGEYLSNNLTQHSA